MPDRKPPLLAGIVRQIWLSQALMADAQDDGDFLDKLQQYLDCDDAE